MHGIQETKFSNEAQKPHSCEIIIGDANQELLKFPEKHFQCCVTSPPYWGLRDYGIQGSSDE